jgi:hypothetical protein
LLIIHTWTNMIKTYNKDRASKSKLYDLFANAVEWKTLWCMKSCRNTIYSSYEKIFLQSTTVFSTPDDGHRKCPKHVE